MKFWFSDDMTGENSVAGWSDRALGPFQRHDSFLHFARRYSIRYCPTNEGNHAVLSRQSAPDS